MKNILITGGGGYVGTNLTNELLSKKYKVTVIDTFGLVVISINMNLKIIKKAKTFVKIKKY